MRAITDAVTLTETTLKDHSLLHSLSHRHGGCCRPPPHTHTSTTSSLSRKMSYDVKRTAVTHLSTSSALTLLYRTHLCHWPLGQPQQGPRMNPYATRADRKCRRGASQKAIKSQGEWKVFFFQSKLDHIHKEVLKSLTRASIFLCEVCQHHIVMFPKIMRCGFTHRSTAKSPRSTTTTTTSFQNAHMMMMTTINHKAPTHPLASRSTTARPQKTMETENLKYSGPSSITGATVKLSESATAEPRYSKKQL